MNFEKCYAHSVLLLNNKVDYGIIALYDLPYIKFGSGKVMRICINLIVFNRYRLHL